VQEGGARRRIKIRRDLWLLSLEQIKFCGFFDWGVIDADLSK
jgi:hypothetical protein